MEAIVFSETLRIPDDSAITVVRKECEPIVQELKRTRSAPIYLCGGGMFAGVLLAAGRIDILCVKRAPVVLGGGTRLFEEDIKPPVLRHMDSKAYDGGYLLQQYDVISVS